MAQNKKTPVIQIAAELAAPILQELGLTLWDVRFEKEGSSWYLRYFIDKENGVNIDDCEQFSRKIDKLLDEADPIPQSYYLEVSSPGIERELRRPEHFEFCRGEKVRIKTIRPVDGIREFIGILHGAKDGRVEIVLNNGELKQFEIAQTAYIRIYDDFTDGGQES